MNTLIQSLNDNLKLIYRKAVDADKALDQLQGTGKGKFESIFTSESGFATSSKRFKPYVEEVAADIQNLQGIDSEQLEIMLPPLVKRIQLMITTLEQFKKTY